MPYGNDPANDTADELRFLIGDVADPPILSDDEIDYLLTTSTSVQSAAYLAAQRISTKFGAKSDKTVGDLSISYQSRADQYAKLAATFQNQSPPIPLSSVPAGTDDQEFMFGIGMMDHPENKIKVNPIGQ